jgi:CheY-like chemotaxis protein
MDQCDVLIVDDDYSVRDSLRFILTEVIGLSVQEASSGKEGLARLSELRPRVVLLDLKMPILNGQSVIDAMQSTPDLAGIPVVIMSGTDECPLPVLQKPFSLAGLITTLTPYFPGISASRDSLAATSPSAAARHSGR